MKFERIFAGQRIEGELELSPNNSEKFLSLAALNPFNQRADSPLGGFIEPFQAFFKP